MAVIILVVAEAAVALYMLKGLGAPANAAGVTGKPLITLTGSLTGIVPRGMRCGTLLLRPHWNRN